MRNTFLADSSAFSPEKTSLGQPVFNPLISPCFPKFGIAFLRPAEPSAEPLHPVSPGPCKSHPPAHKRRAARRKGAARIGFPIISKRSPYFGGRSVSRAPPALTASDLPQPEQRSGTNLPYVSADRGNCWNQCLIKFLLWQTACRYIFLCQSRRGRRGARELGDAEWKWRGGLSAQPARAAPAPAAGAPGLGRAASRQGKVSLC